METKDGNVAEVEPVVTEASKTDGVDTTTIVKPEADQSEGKTPGEVIQKGVDEVPQPSWLAQLPKDLKNDKQLMERLGKNPTIGDFVRASVKTEGTEGETEPEVQKPLVYENFEKKLNVDADPFGKISNSLKATLEQMNVPKEQAEQLFDLIVKEQEATMAEFLEKGIPWCENELKTFWKDDYDNQRKAVTRGTKALMQADPDLMKELDKTGASINPAVARMIAIYGNAIKEDGSIGSNISSTGSKRNPKVPVNYPD